MITITSYSTPDPGLPKPKGFSDSVQHDAWKVQLTIVGDGKPRRMTVPFFMGEGLRRDNRPTPPTTGDVLECLALDASSFDQAAGYDDWADEFGYDTTEGVSTYRAVERQTAKLRIFLGDAYDAVLYKGPETGWSSVAGDITINTEEPENA